MTNAELPSPETRATGTNASPPPKKPLQSFLIQVAFLAFLFGALPSIDSAYAYLFTTSGNAAFGSLGGGRAVEYAWVPPRDRHDRGEVHMVGKADRTAYWESSFTVRDRGFLPTAVLVALMLATPARSRGRTAAAVLAGSVVLNVFFLIQTAFLAASLFAAADESLMPLGGWLAAALPITKAFFGSAMIRYAAVFAVWTLFASPATRIDFGVLTTYLRRITPPGTPPRS